MSHPCPAQLSYPLCPMPSTHPSSVLHSAITTGQEEMNLPLVPNPQAHGFIVSHVLLFSVVAHTVTPGGRDVCAMPAAPWSRAGQPHFSQLHSRGLFPKPVRGRRPWSPSRAPHLLCPGWRWKESSKKKTPKYKKELGKGKRLVNPWVSREATPAAARNTNVVSVW